ncbi:MAG TPA: hypothetical protein VLX92_28445 [Kofleriaceae bacterium]|nr:hypothetical protein [Kofleriaceae bacterium]
MRALVIAVVVAGAALGHADPKGDAHAANVRGMKLYEAKDYAGAAAQFRAAIAADPTFVLAHYNLASMAALVGDKPTVLDELRWLARSKDPEARRALAKAPTDPDLHAVIDDPEVKAVLGLDCAAVCARETAACADPCGDARGCLRLCDWGERDCEDGCAAGMSAAARARMRAWIDGPLTGRDNPAARMRAASIAHDDMGGPPYTAYIKNELGFTCQLTWSADGSPGKLAACKSETAGWHTEPAEIPLRCRLDARHKLDRCEGSYRLHDDASYDEASTFVLERAIR